jgi:hypothetical protein
MNLACLIFATILPMLNPDGVPLDNGILDEGAILAYRALNTALDKDVSLSATVTVSIEGGEIKDAMPRREEFAYMRNSGWQRFEFDAAKVSMNLDSRETETLTRLQLQKAVHIFSVGKNTSWWIYPPLKVYIEGQAETPGFEGQFDLAKIEKEKIGDEVVEGHKCVKYKVKVHCFMGDLDGTRWEAVDLQGLPIKTVVKMDDATITTVLKNIKLGAPAAEMFTVPKEYRRYTGEEFFKYLEKIILKEAEEKQKSK